MSGDRAGIEAAWLALLSLPGLGPARLWEVAVAGDPMGEWERLRAGASPRSFGSDAEQRARWRGAAATLDPSALAELHADAGVVVTIHGDAAHPSLDERDPHVPPVLLWKGRVAPPDPRARPVIGIVGTRRASRAGLELARAFARDLTLAGCTVASGLALGVDAAAHRGALEIDGATPLAVVGSGLDVVYPRANRGVWHDVVGSGAICSEYPLGTAPAAWRFPARNRILVALCDALVVVESHERGGSLITAGIAGARGVPVLAVPGAIRSPTSVGTNRLIADGCQPCLGVVDILDAVGLSSAPQLVFGSAPDDGAAPASLTPDEVRLLDAVGWTAHSLDELADACPDLGLGALSVALAGLLASGVLAERDGRIERAH